MQEQPATLDAAVHEIANLLATAWLRLRDAESPAILDSSEGLSDSCDCELTA